MEMWLHGIVSPLVGKMTSADNLVPRACQFS